MQIPESMKTIWENITNTNQKTGDVNSAQLEQLKQAASSDGKIDEQEQEFINYVESNLMISSNNNQGKGSNPVSFVDTEFGKVPSSMIETWNQVSTDGVIDEADLEKLKQAAAPTGKNSEFDNDEVNFLANLVEKAENGQVRLNNPNTTKKNNSSISSPFGEVPFSLQSVWNQIVSKGQVSLQDLDNLITAATPNEKPEEIDEKERTFLLKIKEAIEENNGQSVLLSSNINKASSPTLLNWPGYTAKTKQALRDAYGEFAIGTRMPLLRQDIALEVAKGFGVSSVRELQSMIGAKVDGKFGPETYFKAKAFVANLMNTNSQDPRIPNMLSVLGNDIEVRRMIEMYGAFQINNNQQNLRNQQQPVNNDKPPVSIGDTDPNNPEAIKSFQNKVNLLSSIYNNQKGTNFEPVEVNGKLTESFADKLRNMEQTIGKPVAQAIAEIENELKSKGFSKLDSRSLNFVKIADNGIQIIGDAKDMVRINAAKELLAKLGFNLTNFEISKPENPGVNGDLILKSNNMELKIFDNVSFEKRDHNKYGDLHIVGKFDNKDIDVSYWENDRRGEKSIKQFNRFHLKAKVNGQELEPLRQSESILSKPLIQVK
ncbi:MAG: hypothetical protein KatS3mg068_0611 [Candidatus Sericytochromatia bacterium]|nr:MAG: hypothetical protein KatS3mg068_0611 [Candidatus Sericytochromatia bacterium]